MCSELHALQCLLVPLRTRASAIQVNVNCDAAVAGLDYILISKPDMTVNNHDILKAGCLTETYMQDRGNAGGMVSALRLHN